MTTKPCWRNEPWTEEHARNMALTMEKKYGKRDKSQIIPIFLSCLNMKKTCEETGYSRALVHRVLNKAGITDRDYKQNVDSTVFETIDSSEKAYWLGFITADGYIMSGRQGNGTPKYVVALQLQDQDKLHIEKFRDFTKSKHKISQRWTKSPQGKKFPSWGINISNKPLALSLQKYGIVQRKSQIAYPCLDLIPQEFHRDYWRGLVDGDGMVSWGDNSRPYIGLCGTKPVVEGFLEFIKPNLSPTCGVEVSEQYNGTMYSARFTGFDSCREIAKILYEGAEVYLDRKYETAMALISATE